MNDVVGPRLTAEQLLEVERLCDRYERERRDRVARPLAEYVREASPAVRERLEADLRRLVEELGPATLHGEAANPLTIAEHPLEPVEPLRVLRAGRYELDSRLGSGGAGTVWRAFDRQLLRWVALKTPHAGLVSDSQRFVRECRAAARLQHRRIVRVLDAGEDEAGCYLVSELVEGMSLGERLRRQPFAPREAAEVLAEIAEGLAYAHGQGIVHRDLKPHNILLDKTGAPYISDFGLAKEWDSQAEQLTRTGAIVGTPAFMSPEQARGDVGGVDPRTDVYSLGVVLFQLLTNELPFRGNSESVLYQVLNAEPPPPRSLNRGVPPELETLCLKCLEKSPEARFQQADELLAELRRFLAGRPIVSRPLGPLGRGVKWAQRNPTLAGLSFVTAASTLALLVGALVVAARQREVVRREAGLRVEAEASARDARQAAEREAAARNDEREARRNAEAAAARARDEALLSRQSLEFLESTLQASDPVEWVLGVRDADPREAAPRDPPQLRELLDAAALRAREELRDRPRVQARLLDALANAYRGAGELERSRELLDEADTVRAAEDHAAEATVDHVRHELYAGLWSQDRGEFEAAETRLRGALRRLAESGADEPLLAADVQFHLGWLLLQRRRHGDAAAAFAASLALRERHLPANDRALAAARIGTRLSRGEPLETAALAELESLADRRSWVLELATDYLKVVTLRAAGRWDEAGTVYAQLVETLERRLGERHRLHVLALGDYADLLWRRGDYRAALPAIRRAIRLGESISPSHPRLRDARLQFAGELLRGGRFAEAESHYRQVVAHDEARGAYSDDAHQGLVWACLATGRVEEAGRIAEELVRRTADSTPHQRAWHQYALARSRTAARDEAGARQADAEAYRLAKSIEMPPEHAVWLERLSTILIREGDYAPAEPLLEKAVEIERRTRPADHPRIADRMNSLAWLYVRTERPLLAGELLADALRIREARLPDDDTRLSETRAQLERLGRP